MEIIEYTEKYNEKVKDCLWNFKSILSPLIK